MNPKAIRILTHIVIVLLTIIGGILAIADKVAALPFIPPDWTNKWGLFVTAAIAVKPILLIIGDLLDDGIINQSFKGMPAVVLCLLLLSGCATNTGDAKKDKRGRVFNAVATEAATVAWDFALSAGKTYLQGRNGQDAAAAAFAAAAIPTPTYSISNGIARIRAAAGPQVATAAQKAIVAANPQTPQQVAVAFNSVGATFQLAANPTAPARGDGQP